jgi:hypothetical protein
VHGLVTRLWVGNQTVQHSRAFHLPDAGVFLTLDVSVPVIAKEPEPEGERSDQPTDDEWERARREVRGDGSAEGLFFPRLSTVTPLAAEIDPASVEKVVDVILRTLARHAARVEGLTSRETFTVAVRLAGRSRTLLQTYEGEPHGYQFGFQTLDEPEDAPKGLENGMEKTYSAYVVAAGHEVADQNLVVRVALSDLGAFADAGGTGGSLEKLRQRAQVNRY